MQLNLTSAQFLALYSFLGSAEHENTKVHEIKSIRQEMEDTILEILEKSNKNKNKIRFDRWVESEQERITHLEYELDSLKTDEASLLKKMEEDALEQQFVKASTHKKRK